MGIAREAFSDTPWQRSIAAPDRPMGMKYQVPDMFLMCGYVRRTYLKVEGQARASICKSLDIFSDRQLRGRGRTWCNGPFERRTLGRGHIWHKQIYHQHLISSHIIWSYITKSSAAQLMFESKQCQASSQLWSQWLDWTRGKDSLRLNSWNPQNIQKLIFLTLSSLTVNSRRHFRCCNTAFPQDKTHHQSGSYVATRYQHECQVNVFSYSK